MNKSRELWYACNQGFLTLGCRPPNPSPKGEVLPAPPDLLLSAMAFILSSEDFSLVAKVLTGFEDADPPIPPVIKECCKIILKMKVQIPQ